MTVIVFFVALEGMIIVMMNDTEKHTFPGWISANNKRMLTVKSRKYNTL